MDLVFAQYYNIWPFKDIVVNINFRKWKYLIKAPIWSGKSFLFFDAPFFWLYWSKFRNILNKKSQEWFVRIIFSIWNDDNKQFYLVERLIKATRTGGESVQLRVFSLQIKNEVFFNSNIFSADILSFQEKKVWLWKTFLSVYNEFFKLMKDIFNIEELKFKSSSEWQKLLNELLPPKEVFLSTCFLMQDSDNIFEMSPSERINIFKNIFNLIWIDEIKDKLAERKKELNLHIKLLSSEDRWVQKFHAIKSKMLELYKQLNFFIKEDLIFDLMSWGISEPFDFDFEKYRNLLQDQKAKYQQLEKEEKILIEAKNTLELKKKGYEKQLSKLQSSIEEKRKILKDFDKNQYEKLKEEYFKLKEKINSLLNQYLSSLDINYRKLLWDKDFQQISKYFDDFINEWLQLRSKLDNLKLQYEKIKQEYDFLNKKLEEVDFKPGTQYYQLFITEKKKIETEIKSKINEILIEIKNLEEKKQQLQQQREELLQQIEEISKILTKELKFSCSLIKKDCPFIKDIKKEQVAHLENQINNIKVKIKEIESQIKEIDKLLEEKKKQKIQLEKDLNEEWVFRDLEKKYKNKILQDRDKILEELKKLNFEEKKKNIFFQISEIESVLSKKREELKKMNYSLFKNLYNESKKLYQKVKLLEDKLLNMEKMFQEIWKFETEILTMQAEINKINQFLSDLLEEEKQLVLKLTKLQAEKEKILLKDVDNIEKNFKEFESLYFQWKNLYQEYKDAQIEVDKYKQEYKIVSDLYNIFSKELMLLVLDDFLPLLFEVINSYLSKVVDFQLKHELKKKWKDRLELEIFVSDDKWERGVKSLSGWQKTVLKLAWILAIAQMVQPEFLFLDETINNLDFESIWRVADMIEEFVEKNNIKFYVVTHSKQIQDMNIWDEIIEVEK